MTHFLRGWLMLGMALVMSACDPVKEFLPTSLDPEDGKMHLEGLAHDVIVRRDALGVPLIEADNDDDAMRAVGYVMASDRLAQMLSYTLGAQGRLAEMGGPALLDLDVYLRTLGLRQISEQQYSALSPRLRHWLECFAEGVNGYLQSHRGHLPLDIQLAGYVPEKWTPINSMDVMTMMALSLALNAHEELSFLSMAQRVGWEKAAWLVPSYPDEPIALTEAAKIKGLNLSDNGIESLLAVQKEIVRTLTPLGKAASNNWAVAPARTRFGASLLANDTHLALEHPPTWMLMQLHSPSFHVAGVAAAGVPGVVCGSNGRLAWGMTMVMADTQDIFLEKVRRTPLGLEYLQGQKWLPVPSKEEVFHIRGQADEHRLVYRTAHGPLLNSSLMQTPVAPIQPVRMSHMPFGLAFSWSAYQADGSMDAMFRMMQAGSVAEARTYLPEMKFIHVNMLLADHDHIGWQVTGRYPLRRQGLGVFPSPGWTGEFDWVGEVPAAKLPSSMDPATGFIATANDRTVAADYPVHLTSSWFAPERGERIRGVLARTDHADAFDMRRLQSDQTDLTVIKMQAMFKSAPMATALPQALAKLDTENARNARRVFDELMSFDGVMKAESRQAALYGLFLHEFTREVFLDELGPEDSDTWQAFLDANAITYSAQEDHLLGRDDSPFWDDVRTSAHETKADILARTLAQTWQEAKRRLGSDPRHWQWGMLHQYFWQTGLSHLKPYLPASDRAAASLLGLYTDRGPYPAGGSLNTVNVAGYTVGENFDVWDIPAMRMVVDFSQKNPLWLSISGGQSGNPVSPHYDDGIPGWVRAENRSMPMDEPELSAQYRHVLQLSPQ